MKNIYHSLIAELEAGIHPVLATLISTRGSTPQVPGASAIFSNGRLLAGTLGGGFLEGDAAKRTAGPGRDAKARIYELDLDADISSGEGAVCGGSALVLNDPDPGRSIAVFRELERSIANGVPGVLLSLIKGKKDVEVDRYWFRKLELGRKNPVEKKGGKNSGEEVLKEFQAEMSACLENRECLLLRKSEKFSVFIEPVLPLPKLYIAGAGHIGKALAHLAGLLDFEVTVIDDRAEYASSRNIPDADRIIVGTFGELVRDLPMTRDTYVVIATRGHSDDADALKACIGSELAYLGMLGSRKKIRHMREKFLSEGWATQEQFDRVHAPVGLEIGSKTVQEIVLSIAAQLVQVRNRSHTPPAKSHHISAIILAAGESTRMGEPKLLLPFGDSSIIGKVVSNAIRSRTGKVRVVLGSDHEVIGSQVKKYPVETLHNREFKQGMLSSVKCGLSSLPETDEAAMILLGDQPMIGPEIMNGLIETYRRSDRGIIVASFRGKRGHPILIGSGYFGEVLAMGPENSLKDLLALHPDDIEEVESGNPAILRDIDTKKDYQEELRQKRNYD